MTEIPPSGFPVGSVEGFWVNGVFYRKRLSDVTNPYTDRTVLWVREEPYFGKEEANEHND